MRVHVVFLTALAACHSAPPNDAAPAMSPVGVEWTLTSLGGQPVGKGAGGRPATLLLTDISSRASGFAGCNQFSGTYTLSGTSLAFGPLALTRMACADGDVLERSYTMALEQTTTFRATSKRLELRKGSVLLATFTRP
ncbi:MAG TPA: META domain-containing protein [Gemmatimonadales bacterium]|nr:META domain-containing protein [Gemmatimonadales bacterium]